MRWRRLRLASIFVNNGGGMDEKFYTVARIEGEYAVLKNEQDGGEVFIALALLPFGADLGVLLKYANFEYSIC